jgi:hypothetical protein
MSSRPLSTRTRISVVSPLRLNSFLQLAIELAFTLLLPLDSPDSLFSPLGFGRLSLFSDCISTRSFLYLRQFSCRPRLLPQTIPLSTRVLFLRVPCMPIVPTVRTSHFLTVLRFTLLASSLLTLPNPRPDARWSDQLPPTAKLSNNNNNHTNNLFLHV